MGKTLRLKRFHSDPETSVGMITNAAPRVNKRIFFVRREATTKSDPFFISFQLTFIQSSSEFFSQEQCHLIKHSLIAKINYNMGISWAKQNPKRKLTKGNGLTSVTTLFIRNKIAKQIVYRASAEN